MATLTANSRSTLRHVLINMADKMADDGPLTTPTNVIRLQRLPGQRSEVPSLSCRPITLIFTLLCLMSLARSSPALSSVTRHQHATTPAHHVSPQPTLMPPANSTTPLPVTLGGCVYSGHLQTDRNWFGYLVNISVSGGSARLAFEFAYPAERGCQNVLFYSNEQAAIVNARMNCWQKEYLLRPEDEQVCSWMYVLYIFLLKKICFYVLFILFIVFTFFAFIISPLFLFRTSERVVIFFLPRTAC
jgi:hypothetical protein